MTAKILPLPSRRSKPQIGDEVICHRDGARGFIETIFDNKIGKPALAAVRAGGVKRLLSFADFQAAPRRQQKATG